MYGNFQQKWNFCQLSTKRSSTRPTQKIFFFFTKNIQNSMYMIFLVFYGYSGRYRAKRDFWVTVSAFFLWIPNSPLVLFLWIPNSPLVIFFVLLICSWDRVNIFYNMYLNTYLHPSRLLLSDCMYVFFSGICLWNLLEKSKWTFKISNIPITYVL